MKILLTGANGYIGTRLLPLLIEEGHDVYALVRSKERFLASVANKNVHVIEADLLDPLSLKKIPDDIDCSYYLVHSMSYSKNFSQLEEQAAINFRERIDQTKAKQIIYLGGLANESNLSEHLRSRKRVGEILKQGKTPVTILMAGIIIGSGSASFEIIRDLVEKLPIMVAPKWVMNLTQPIAIRDILYYLTATLGDMRTYHQSYEVGGPDVLTYKELILRFAAVRGLKRYIITVPILTPRLSSYWLFFVTSTSFSLARFLVDSLINNAICKENRIHELYPRRRLTYTEAVGLALARIEEDWIPSSWRDSLSGSSLNPNLSLYLQVPHHGVLFDQQHVSFQGEVKEVQARIWALGGKNGWPAMNWAWTLRGFIDQIVGGTGLRRGRTHPTRLRVGDALDFWRVLNADEEHGRLLLYAEMKLPGEAWLEFEIIPTPHGGVLRQKATFRPRGLLGRLYWYILYPFHLFLFRQLAERLANSPKNPQPYDKKDT